jgi:hypothetical protein
MTPQIPSVAETTIEVDCPYLVPFGLHQVELHEPVIDEEIALCPLCQMEYRVHKGPPVTLTKYDG